MPPFCHGPAMAGKGGHAKSPMNEPDDKARIQDSASVWTDGSHQSFEQPGESTGPASVWKYGYGLDFKQQPDDKAKSQRASGSTGYGLDFKQQPDNKAKAQRASGSTATALTASTTAPTSSSSSRTAWPRPSERLEVRLRPRLQAAAGQQGQGPASVRKYGCSLDFCKQQPDNKAKAQRAFGSTATASTSSSSRPRLSKRMEARLRPQQPDNKSKFQRASGSTATASTSCSSWTKRPRPSERPALFQAAAKQRQGLTSVWKYSYASTSCSSSQTTRQTPCAGRLRLLQAAAGPQGKGPMNAWR